MFFAGAGALGLVTRVLTVPGSNRMATAAVYGAGLALGVVIWVTPWERWPRQASLAIVPPAFALIALGNAFRGPDLHTYSVFFVVAFVWIGMAHRPRTSLAMAPLAAAAYILPLFVLPGRIGPGLSSAAVTIPVCVLVGEGIAWGVGKLEQIELALGRERDQTEQLRALDEMKDRFLSSVSHELRTPITICRGHLEVLEDGADEREVRAVKAMLVDELDLMGRLVEDLATLARDGDQALVSLESLPLEPFLRSIAAKAPAILGDRVRVQPGIRGAMLRADPQRLTQALMNLLQNAADHAKGTLPCPWGSGPSRQAGVSRWPTRAGDCRPAMSKLSSNRSAPDHREAEARDWGSPLSGDWPEPMAGRPGSLTGPGWGPRSGSGFRGEAPAHRG